MYFNLLVCPILSINLILATWQKALVAALLLLFACFFLMAMSKKRAYSLILLFLVVAMSLQSVSAAAPDVHLNYSKSQKKPLASDNPLPHHLLSKDGKNVVIIMLDRAQAVLLPYLFKEKTELQKQFAGFTYYSNVISYGTSTNFGAPALFGGYEYTPIELNRRKDEPLVNKHNEALKVMPAIFYGSKFDVTVCDPVYANYRWDPDLSIYNSYPGMKTYNAYEKFTGANVKPKIIKGQRRLNGSGQADLCTRYDKYYANNFNAKFMHNYNVLFNLPRITGVSYDNRYTFLMMTNDLPHQPELLQMPDYLPALSIDNRNFEQNNDERFTIGDNKLRISNEDHYGHYHVNMLTMILIGRWLDYLRSCDVYDNTRIILVADHGRDMFLLESLELRTRIERIDVGGFYPLLMVKDFGSSEYSVSDEFMTNADVPTLATAGLISKPINPFTGKIINSDEKTAHPQYVIASKEWDTSINNGHTFLPSVWLTVQDNIWDKDNWKVVSEGGVLPKEG